MSLRPATARDLMSFGLVAGSVLGLAAGAAEAVLPPHGTLLRLPYVLGADGLLGAAWGLAAALLLLPFRGGVPHDRTLGRCLSLITFPFLAAALGLAVNRWLLSGTHFLSPVSLVADAVALLLALFLAVVIGRRLRSAPRTGTAAVVLPALLFLAWFLPPRALERGAGDPGLPPIVVVSIDTLRPDKLSAGGDPRGTSPELDRLCREGIQFSEALAVSPGSAASHAALLTSRYPVSSGVWANFSVMDGSVVTLAEILRESGYRTGGFVTNTFLGKRFHFEQGFDSYVESGVVEAIDEPSAATLWRSLAVVQIVDRIRPRFELGYDPSFESALRWLDESDRPTFWFVHLMDVHSPYVPPSPYGPRFGADPDGGPDTADRKRNKFGWRPSEEAYVAEIRFADDKIGRLRRALERRGWLDDAVLLLTSDHGENLLDHEPHFSHGVTLFDSTLRILAALRAPGRLRPALITEPWENVDALPQIAEVLGWDPHPDWEGRPLTAPARTTPTYGQLNRDFAVRTPEWKVVLREDGTREVYDLIRDPGETQPLADADRTDEADAAFRAWLGRTATPLYLEQARSVKPDELSPETVEKLKSLGYLE